MLKNIKTRAIWMAIGIVIGGSALSYAGVAATSSHKPTNKPTVHASVEPEESESPEPSESSEPNAQHPINHGFYVSLAAQCKDVNDATNHITFTAPADCATNGQAHGAYVSSVARSDAGKGAHGNAKNKGKPQ
jgi:cell division septation protein DedD